MNISVFGLGYVGCVTMAWLADRGHRVCGVDINETKVEMLNSGTSPIIEPGLGELIDKGQKAGFLRATNDALEAVVTSEMSIVCVGTPSQSNGALSLHGVKEVSRQIGKALAEKKRTSLRGCAKYCFAGNRPECHNSHFGRSIREASS